MTPAPISPLIGALTTQVGIALPIIASIFGVLFGLVFVIAFGKAIINWIKDGILGPERGNVFTNDTFRHGFSDGWGARWNKEKSD